MNAAPLTGPSSRVRPKISYMRSFSQLPLSSTVSQTKTPSFATSVANFSRASLSRSLRAPITVSVMLRKAS